MSIHESIGDLLRAERKKRGVSVPDLAGELGIPKDRIYKWEKGVDPRREDRERIMEWIRGNWKDIPHETVKHAHEPETPYEREQLSMRAIVNLTESNVSLARSHEELVMMLKSKTAATVDADVESQLSMFATFRDLLLKVGIDAGSWRSRADGMKVLSKVAGENAPGKKVTNT